MRSLLITTLFGWLLLLSACATDNAARVRAQRPVTVGLPGVAYRPAMPVSIGATVGIPVADAMTVDANRDKARPTAKAVDGETLVTMHSSSYGAFMHTYLWPTSAFFIGLDARQETRKYKFDAATAGSNSLAPEYTDVAYTQSRTLLTPTIGWDWIWENGFSLFLGAGPQIVLSSAKHWNNDGSAGDADAQKRDQTVDALDKYDRRMISFSGTTLIGYSF